MTNINRERSQVDVITVFTKDSVKPFSFKWSGKKFIVEKINLTFSKKVGLGMFFYYSITSEGNYFKLVFEANEMKWFVEEVVTE